MKRCPHENVELRRLQTIRRQKGEQRRLEWWRNGWQRMTRCSIHRYDFNSKEPITTTCFHLNVPSAFSLTISWFLYEITVLLSSKARLTLGHPHLRSMRQMTCTRVQWCCLRNSNLVATVCECAPIVKMLLQPSMDDHTKASLK